MRRLRRALALAAMLVGAMLAASPAADDPRTAKSLVRSDQPRVGDLDAMVARRAIRALVAYSKTFYFLDGGKQRGLSYEQLQAFEKFVNRRFKTGTLKIHVIIIPVARDELLPALVEGRGDLAVANLTITDKRRRMVDFSAPFLKDVSEIVVSGAKAAPLTRLEDFAGRLIEVGGRQQLVAGGDFARVSPYLPLARALDLEPGGKRAPRVGRRSLHLTLQIARQGHVDAD